MRASDEVEVEVTDLNDGELILFQLLLEQGWLAAALRVIEVTKRAAEEAERTGDEDRARCLLDGHDIMWALHCNFTFGHCDRLPVGLVSADLGYTDGEWTTARSLLAHTGYFGETEPGELPAGELNGQVDATDLDEADLAQVIALGDIDITIFSLMIEAGWIEAAPLAIDATERKWAAANESFDRERAGHWAETAELMRTTLACVRARPGEGPKSGLLSARLVYRSGLCVLCRGVFDMSERATGDEPGGGAQSGGKFGPIAPPGGDPALN